MRIGTAVLATLAVGCLAANGGPLQKNQVPASATWVAHADIEALKATQIGGALLDRLQSGDADNKFAAFKVIFNFDPRKDLRAMTVYGKDAGTDRGVAILNGKFDADQIATLLKGKDSYESDTYNHHVIHSWVEGQGERGGGARIYGCIMDGSVAILTKNADYGRIAIDVLDGKLPDLQGGGELTALLPNTPTALFIAAAELQGVSPLARATIIQQAKAGSFSLTEKEGFLQGALHLTAIDTQTAQLMGAVAQGMIAAGELNGQQKPALARLASGSAVTVDGSNVNVSMKYPVAEAIELLNKLPAKTDRGTPDAAMPEGREGAAPVMHTPAP